MKNWIGIVFVLSCLSMGLTSAKASTPSNALMLQGGGSVAVGSSKFAWDQSAPTLGDAQGYTYRVYSDGASPGTVITATCTGTVSPFQCEAPLLAYTPGTHTAELTAANVAGESAKTLPLSFTFVVTPAVPTNFRTK